MKRLNFTQAFQLAIPALLANGLCAQAQDTQVASQTLPAATSNLGNIFDEKDLNVGVKCRPKQRFFLRGQISEKSLFYCDLDIGGGASLSYTRNSVTGINEITAKAGFGIRLGEELSFGNHTRAGLIGYADVDSKTESTGQDQSQLRIGIDGSFITDFGNARAANRAAGSLIYTIGAYYLTDVDFDASGYGIKATAHPQIPGLRVNFKKPRQNFHWYMSTTLEALKVSDAGSTGLSDDTDYAWASLSLKGIYKAKPKAFSNGIEVSFGSEYAKDFVSGDELHQFKAETKVFLDPDESVALSLSHTRGETRSRPTFVKTTTLNLEFKF